MKADNVLFVRKGTFEMTKHFNQQESCHLTGKEEQGPIISKTQFDELGRKVPKRDDNFIAH